MASVVEDAETYQQSSIVPPFHLESHNDLVPLTNPTVDLSTVRRSSSLGVISRGILAVLMRYKYMLIIIILCRNKHDRLNFPGY